MLANNADVNASRHTDGATPLYIATCNGHTELVQLLLANTADVNAARGDGDMPIDAARRHHHLEIVELLQ